MKQRGLPQQAGEDLGARFQTVVPCRGKKRGSSCKKKHGDTYKQEDHGGGNKTG
jgi:hypothetical protein